MSADSWLVITREGIRIGTQLEAAHAVRGIEEWDEAADAWLAELRRRWDAGRIKNAPAAVAWLKRPQPLHTPTAFRRDWVLREAVRLRCMGKTYKQIVAGLQERIADEEYPEPPEGCRNPKAWYTEAQKLLEGGKLDAFLHHELPKAMKKQRTA